VVFDGPVDALWVENMNSVLDDSMVLCLSNGERIKLHPKMKILFEVRKKFIIKFDITHRIL